jgi:GTP-binding protein EngB required for normal cell division
MADPCSAAVLAAITAVGVGIASGLVVQATVSFTRRLWSKLRKPTRPPPHVEQVVPAVLGRETSKAVTPEQVIERVRKDLGIDCQHHYNFAVCGSTGSGKSSLVNALRGVPDNDPQRAAEVDIIETTQRTTPYKHPENDYVIFWDLPGAGTIRQPARDYFRSKHLFAFDVLIVVCAERILEVDLEIANMALEWGVPVLFVRNKFDRAFAAHMRLRPSGTILGEQAKLREVSQLKQKLVNDVRQQLKVLPKPHAKLFSCEIYVVSAWRFLDETVLTTGDEVRLLCDLLRLAARRAPCK